MSVPQTSPEGWFEPTVGQADPLDWPWALPALFCINFARDSGNELVGFSSKLNGSSQSISRFEDERYRVETIGFWRGDYRVVELLRFKNRTRAERHALDQFEALPVRYLMEGGVVVREKPEIDVSGNWPVDWQFGSIRDLGVCCAYIYERALVKKSHQFAREFRINWRSMALNGTNSKLPTLLAVCETACVCVGASSGPPLIGQRACRHPEDALQNC